MTSQVLKFVELNDRDRKKVRPLSAVGRGDEVELRVVHPSGGGETTSLPLQAATLFSTILDHLSRGEKVAVLAEERELSPNDAASILGISRPLVVHRMEVGDLPFRYVGKHRRAKVKDVLALKSRIDAQQAALDALADETEQLMQYGL
jgi:hypothetical protein